MYIFRFKLILQYEGDSSSNIPGDTNNLWQQRKVTADFIPNTDINSMDSSLIDRSSGTLPHPSKTGVVTTSIDTDSPDVVLDIPNKSKASSTIDGGDRLSHQLPHASAGGIEVVTNIGANTKISSTKVVAPISLNSGTSTGDLPPSSSLQGTGMAGLH